MRQRINLMLLNISNRTLRQSRINRFIELIHPVSGMSILDLGGWDGRLLQQIVAASRLSGGRWIVADIDPQVEMASEVHGFETVVLREGSALPFEDGEIDVVWCNSVIEHITPGPDEACVVPGKIADKDWRCRSYDLQRAFASEIRRISKSYFVQTPDRRFPIEVHTAIPGASYLSHNSTIRLASLLKRFWPRPIGYVDWNLLTLNDMQTLFPDGSVEVESFLGVPKSIIAWKRG
jgi:SAM-dependent methyltransferase